MSYDNACKYLAEQYPADFVRWLLGVEPTQIEVLKTELTLEPIRADSVTFLQANNQILHIEFQTLTKSKTPLNFRMLDYSVRLKRQYRCPVHQVIIFLKETDNEIAFTDEYRDNTTIHKFEVVRLWEQDSTVFLDNPALIPLATLTRTDSPQTLLSQVAQKIATIPDRQQQQNIAGCVEILAGLRFEKNLVRQFLREDIMKESVIYQDIVQKEALKIVNRQIKKRFGEVNDSLMTQIRDLSADELEDLGEALFDFSEIADLAAWLEKNSCDMRGVRYNVSTD
ncbi:MULTISPECIES: Rpn family recombination-promoting nuclease/putative transposase [unclassified Anabaena]|uniref:Rpn family recombination-promoting nuclease/putative transposase n=1 Tax=unclassified Anabaena TaxID=2619674 RepID=UPI0039C74223